jgi:SAM-dependent methyltransferase
MSHYRSFSARNEGDRIVIYRIVVTLICSFFIPGLTHGATTTKEQCDQQFSPKSGQAGKDVIWVPTLDALVSAMLKTANVGPNDYVIDLGSGDGKIPIAAAKEFGARALGVEYNPQMVQLARCYVRVEGLSNKVQIVQGDIFATDFSQATVLTLYLLSDLNLKLRPTILNLKPGTRVVSNTFKMGDWSPDQFIESEIGNTRAYMWIVPAPIEGVWEFREESGEDTFRVQFAQHYQELKSAVGSGESVRGIRDAKLHGADIEFTVIDGQSFRLQGAVDGNLMRLSGQRGTERRYYIGTRQ